MRQVVTKDKFQKGDERMTLSLSAIRERLNRSSAGEWRFDENGVLFAYTQRTMQPLVLVGKKGSLTLKGIDLDFIQHAKTDVLDLIEEVEKVNPHYALEDIKERVNATSKGTWRFGCTGILHSEETHEHIMYGNNENGVEIKEADQHFFENAKSDIDRLLEAATPR